MDALTGKSAHDHDHEDTKMPEGSKTCNITEEFLSNFVVPC